jgi:hypothetical protein
VTDPEAVRRARRILDGWLPASVNPETQAWNDAVGRAIRAACAVDDVRARPSSGEGERA